MPRVRRRHVPGVVTHVIARFVNGEPIMDLVDGARAEYLVRLDRALVECDWTLCWYCLMGTHVHLGLIAGEDPLQSWCARVHSGWAGWLNRRGRRRGLRSRGPVLAERPSTVLVPDGRAPVLGAYIHNNPVRAGLAARAVESDWSSHRAYLGLGTVMAALDIERGLRFFQCTPSEQGRARFDEYVDARAKDPRDPELSGRTAAAARSEARRRAGPVIEVATPKLTDGGCVYPAVVPPHAYRPSVYRGDVARFLRAFTELHGVDMSQLRARGRERSRVALRRSAVLVWRHLGGRSGEMAACLGISAPSATNLVRRATEEELQAAQRMAARLAPRDREGEKANRVP